MLSILAMPDVLAAESLFIFLSRSFRIGFSFAIISLCAFILHKFIIPPMLKLLLNSQDRHHSPLVLLGVVSVCLAMSWLAEALGLSLECGAFFAGLSFVGAKKLEIILNATQYLENLFGSIFFACIGMIISPVRY